MSETDTTAPAAWVAQVRLHEDGDYREAICAWLIANGINPADVPMDARASIADGQLTIPLKVKSTKGNDLIDPSDDTQTFRSTVTVPVTVPPSPDVELWLAPRCTECGR